MSIDVYDSHGYIDRDACLEMIASISNTQIQKRADRRWHQMMWGYGGWGGFGILFPILAVVMMVAMMYFMSRMMMGHHHGHDHDPNHQHRDDTSELLREIQHLRREVEELKREKGKGDF